MELKKNRLITYIVLHWGIGIVIFLSFLISLLSNNGGLTNYTPLLSWLIVLLFCWCLYSWKRATGNLFNPYILFLSALMVFNSGQSFLEIIGANTYGYLNGNFSNDTIQKTIFLSLLCIYIMHLFALITLSKVKIKEDVVEDPIKYKALRTTGMILLAISIVPSISQWKYSIQVVSNSGYMGLYQDGITTGFSNYGALLAAFLTPAIMFLLTGGVDKKWSCILSFILLLISAAILFFLGHRAIAIMPIAAYFWLYDQQIKKISRITLILAGSFLLFILFPLVRAVRSIAGGDKLSFEFLIDSYFSIDNPFLGIINEMGSSMFTVAHTIQLIPTTREFDFGMSYLFAPLTFIPNFFWSVHPSVSHTYSNWLVWEVDPVVAARGGGYGYSAIAEAYANFGWLAPIIMGFVSVLLVIFYTSALKDAAKLALVSSFLSFFFIYARGESIFVTRELLWYAFLPYCLFLFIQIVYKSRNGKSVPLYEIQKFSRNE